MAIIDHNGVPPAPPVHHLPPGHPGQGPRTIHNSAPSLIDPIQLAQHMGRLNVQVEKPIQGIKPSLKPSPPAVETIPRTPLYLGYVFAKSSAVAGQKPNWGRAERTPMNLSQTDLFTMVQKRAKKIPPSQQYQALSKTKRIHVEQLIEDQKRNDPRFEWTCVYVREEERPFKGKNSRRGDYETVSVDVVIVRVPATSSVSVAKEPSSGAVKVDHPGKPEERIIEEINPPAAEEEVVPINKNPQPTVQWAKPEVQPIQTPAMMNPVQQPLPPQFHQNIPTHQHHHHQQHQHHPPPPPPPPPMQRPVLGGRQFASQPSWPQATSARTHQQPVVFGPPRTDFGNGQAGERVNRDPQAVPTGLDAAFHPRTDFGNGHAGERLNRGVQSAPPGLDAPFHPRSDFGNGQAGERISRGPQAVPAGLDAFHPRAEFGNAQTGERMNRGPQPIPAGLDAFHPRTEFGNGQTSERMNRGPQAFATGLDAAFHSAQRPEHGHAPMVANVNSGFQAPNPVNVTAQEPAKPTKTPVEAQPEWPAESNIVDEESIMSDSEEDSAVTEDSDDDEVVVEKPQIWRGSLYRKNSSPTLERQESVFRSHSRKQPSNKNALVPKFNRNRYEGDQVDVVPEDAKGAVKEPSRDVAVQGTRGRPAMIQETVGPTTVDVDPIVYVDERLRGRLRNDIRTRILDDREARLERREKMIDYRARMLDDKLEEARYLDRYGFRESGGGGAGGGSGFCCNHRHMRDGLDGFH